VVCARSPVRAAAPPQLQRSPAVVSRADGPARNREKTMVEPLAACRARGPSSRRSPIFSRTSPGLSPLTADEAEYRVRLRCRANLVVAGRMERPPSCSSRSPTVRRVPACQRVGGPGEPQDVPPCNAGCTGSSDSGALRTWASLAGYEFLSPKVCPKHEFPEQNCQCCPEQRMWMPQLQLYYCGGGYEHQDCELRLERALPKQPETRPKSMLRRLAGI
jgi:hypothetical protein